MSRSGLRWRLPQSLRWRLLLGTLAGLALALVVAGFALSGLFADQAQRQFRSHLQLQLDQLTAAFEVDAAGQPSLGSTLADPRWQQPYGGLYWQVDAPGRQGLLRSRSLWDSLLRLPGDGLPSGQTHEHRLIGPAGQPVLVLERQVIWSAGPSPGPAPAQAAGARSTDQAPAAEAAPGSWRLIVAQDLRELEAAQRRFDLTLAASLAVLGLALAGAAGAQLALGLAPLRRLQRAVQQVRAGDAQRLEGEFPAELHPLVQDFNGVLLQNEQVVQRARQTAGNLAHAIKTPLAVLANAAERPRGDLQAFATLVDEQVRSARAQVEWHLARARMGGSGVPGLRSPVAPVLEGLLRVMRKVHAGRELRFDCDLAPDALAFAGESQDLHEMLGNLLDNACKWAHGRVAVQARAEGRRLLVTVEDDGPGLGAAERERVFERGTRADERQPGSGLGLAIVREVAQLYQGQVRLDASALGGLRASLELPLA
jgi:signal transduction histidine kinase